MKWLGALCLLVLGCGDDDVGTDGGMDAGTDAALDASADGLSVDAGPGFDAAIGPEVFYFEGVYFVPERTETSTYPVAEAKWVRDGDHVALSYGLPRMLVGGSERVSMSGTRSGLRAELAGPLGTATCDLDATGLPISCLEMFVGIEVDLERVRDEAIDGDPANVEARVDVARRFESDPIGVIETGSGLLGPVAVTACDTDADCPGTRCDVETDTRGLCEPSRPNLPLGSACTLTFECADDLECEEDTRRCEPHSG